MNVNESLACCASHETDACSLDAAACNVGDLAARLDIAPSTVSHHLKELARAGIVRRERDGRFHWIRLDAARLHALGEFLVPAETRAHL
jgi:ArsR family transcriptional regulator